MKTATKFFLLLTFFGFFSFFTAQESKEILELKEKLVLAKSDSDKNEINRSIANLYSKLNKKDSLILYVNKTISYYKKVNNTEKLFNNNLVLANYLMRNGDYEEAEKFLIDAQKYVQNSKDLNRKIQLNYSLGAFNTYKKNYNAAQKYYFENIQIYLDGKKVDKIYVKLSYEQLYSTSFVQQNYKDAFKYLNTYIDFVKKNFPENLNLTYQQLGFFYLTTNDYNKALELFKEALLIYEKQNDKNYIAIAKRNIGTSYLGLKKIDSAKTYLYDALNYYKSIDSKENISDINNILSHLYFDEKEYQKAEEYIEKAVKLLPEDSKSNYYHKSYYASVKVYNMVKDSVSIRTNPQKRQELENTVKELNETFSKVQNEKWYVDPDLVISNYTTLSNAYEILGDYKKAHSYFQKAMKEKERVYGLDKMKELSNVQSETELALQKSKIELQEQTKRLQLQKEIELKALKFEYDKKQAAAKTEAERKRLMLEEDLKRKEIQIKFDEEQKAITLKYNQEKQLAKINQEKKDAIAKAELESSKSEKNMWAIGAGLSLLLFGFAGFSYFQKQKDNKKIAEEKQKSDDLLLNILPHEVAEELKEKGKTSAKHYDEVSVLFTDFVSFTANSEKLGVQEVLNELNVCFTEFDRIMERNGLEKIKTIGDAYLAVSGLPVSNEQHAKNAVNAGIEILEFIEKRKKENPTTLDIRIGVHSGPVIAGIVGVKKFAYDIWGDTVNTAARMEQNSAKGRLNISGSTYDLVKDKFTCEHRGKIETKGKGALDMYFVSENKSLI